MVDRVRTANEALTAAVKGMGEDGKRLVDLYVRWVQGCVDGVGEENLVSVFSFSRGLRERVVLAVIRPLFVPCADGSRWVASMGSLPRIRAHADEFLFVG